MSSSEGCAGDSTSTSAREPKPPRPNRLPATPRVKSVTQQQIIATTFTEALSSPPPSHWRADSAGPELEELEADSDQPVGPAAAYDDATALISRALIKLQDAVSAKQFNPTGALSLLSNVHAVLVICLLFHESSLVGTNEVIDGDLREILRALWHKTTEVVKVNKHQTGSSDCSDQSAAAARLSAAIIEQNGQIRLFVDEIDRVWALLKIHSSKAAEAVGAKPNERFGHDQPPLLKLSTSSKISGALRYRWRLARAVTALGLERSLLKQSAVRLLDSLYYCLSTRVFAPVFLLPALIDSYANPEQRIVIISMECMSAAVSLMAFLQPSPRQLRDQSKANRSSLKEIWKALANHLKHDFFNRLSRSHKLSQQWTDFISRALLLYIHFTFSIVAKSHLLLEAAHTLSSHLEEVASRVLEGEQPLSASSIALQETNKQSIRRWSWNKTTPSPTRESPPNERGRALSENSFALSQSYKESDGTLSFSRKRMPQECRPLEGSLLDQEVAALPLGCTMTSPRMIRTLHNVIRSLPVPDALHLFTLLCIVEADEHVLSHWEKESKRVDYLVNLAQEGAAAFESRLGSALFSWDAEETSKIGRETFHRKANSVWSCLRLRFLDVIQESPIEDICRQRLATQEARWASAMIRVLGDSLLQSTGELALPLPLLSPRDVRPEGDDLGDVFPFTPRAAPPPADSYETTNIHTLIALRDVASAQALITKHSSALRLNGTAVGEIEDQVRQLSEVVLNTKENLSTLEAKSGSIERQLIHLLEGPVARHSNQIKSLMDRFDSTAAEIRRLSGVSATQCAAMSNQVSDLKRQLDSSRSFKEDECFQMALRTEVQKAMTDSRETIQTLVTRAQSDVQTFDQRFERLCQELGASATAQIRECQASLKDGQRLALSEALTSLKGLSESVEDLLHRAQNSEEETADHAQRHRMLEEMIRELDLKQTDLEKQIQPQTLVELKNLRGMVVDLTNRLKMMEVFCQDTDIRLTERFAQLEATVQPEQAHFDGPPENRLELVGLEEHFTRCLESLRGECLESVQTLKRKFKHEYLSQLVSKTDELDQQLHALRLMFESNKTKSDVEDMPPRSAKRSVHELRDWMEQTNKQITKAIEGLQWNVADVRRSLDSITATSASDLDAVQSELLELRKYREHLEGQLRLKDQRLHELEVTQEEAKEERARLGSLLEKLEFGQRELNERFSSNDGGSTTRRKLSFWGAPFRREGRTHLSPSTVTWRQDESSQRSKSKSPRPRLNSFLSSPSRHRGTKQKKHRQQPVMEIPVCMRQANMYPPSPTSSINQSMDHGGPISCGTGADGSVQVAPPAKHRLLYTAAMQSNNSV